MAAASVPRLLGFGGGGVAAVYLVHRNRYTCCNPAPAPAKCLVTVHLTGFGAFGGIESNPTSVLCRELKKFTQEGKEQPGVPASLLKEFMASGVRVEGMDAIEVSADACRARVKNIFARAEERRARYAPRVVVHLGVSGAAERIMLECRGANSADFRIPDVKGWQPRGAPVVTEGDAMLYTALALPQILGELHDRGVDCAISTDAGRYICNYIFYSSLHAAEGTGVPVLFVHVPQFEVMDQAAQFTALLCLLLAIARQMRGDGPLCNAQPAETSRPLG